MLIRFLADGSSGGAGLVTFYYVLGCLVAAGSIAIGVWRFYIWQRNKWTDDGKRREQQNQAIEKNNEQLESNTRAIGDLTRQLIEFVTSMKTDIADLRGKVLVVHERVDSLKLRVDTIEKNANDIREPR